MSKTPSTSAGPTEEVYPDEHLIPLEIVEKRIKDITYDLDVEESALVALSKAAEFFLRYLIRQASSDGKSEMTYDSIATVISLTNFETLKEFFPQRVPYRAVAARVAEANERDARENRD